MAPVTGNVFSSRTPTKGGFYSGYDNSSYTILVNCLSQTLHKKRLNKCRKSPDFRKDAVLYNTAKCLYYEVDRLNRKRQQHQERVNRCRNINNMFYATEKSDEQFDSECDSSTSTCSRLKQSDNHDYNIIEIGSVQNHSRINPGHISDSSSETDFDSSTTSAWSSHSGSGDWNDRTKDEDVFGISDFLSQVKASCVS